MGFLKRNFAQDILPFIWRYVFFIFFRAIKNWSYVLYRV